MFWGKVRDCAICLLWTSILSNQELKIPKLLWNAFRNCGYLLQLPPLSQVFDGSNKNLTRTGHIKGSSTSFLSLIGEQMYFYFDNYTLDGPAEHVKTLSCLTLKCSYFSLRYFRKLCCCACKNGSVTGQIVQPIYQSSHYFHFKAGFKKCSVLWAHIILERSKSLTWTKLCLFSFFSPGTQRSVQQAFSSRGHQEEESQNK